ncbi:hypothetical protein V6N11_018870 [Hibiscus sabdariffa]|uniref:Uncharacterized protein n=2 Tax=Hibiscus sabdariffa TaxID=183260 RepID=A0ABR2N6G7_9ROSI
MPLHQKEQSRIMSLHQELLLQVMPFHQKLGDSIETDFAVIFAPKGAMIDSHSKVYPRKYDSHGLECQGPRNFIATKLSINGEEDWFETFINGLPYVEGKQVFWESMAALRGSIHEK